MYEEVWYFVSGWDIYVFESEWWFWVYDKGIDVKDVDKYFLVFCKKCGVYRY